MALPTGLVAQFKLSVGDFNAGTTLDSYYSNFLQMAIDDLITDDISQTQLDSSLGKALTILYAESLMNKTDIASNPTITFLRNKLAVITTGERVLYDLMVIATNCTVAVENYNETVTAGTKVIYLNENLKITATASDGYTLNSLTVNDESFISEDVFKVDGDVEIIATAV